MQVRCAFFELDYEVMFFYLPTISINSATVESIILPLYSPFDALFGFRYNSTDPYEPLMEFYILLNGDRLIYGLQTIVYDDPYPEADECYTIRILRVESLDCVKILSAMEMVTSQ